jgi:adenine-specific DNA-methyltransferase
MMKDGKMTEQNTKPEKLDLRSHNIAEDKVQELLRLFPEIGTEGGKIDFDRLKLALGEAVDVGKERYGMTWPGKAECFKVIQMPSLGTLCPCPDESVNFDTTENLIIEGDNLEVLKLLQKSYMGKVKMIYIDPPYNTGNDFIYPDNYTESLQTYLEYTGQVDAEGRKFGTNTEADGRFHSKWLNMMYPRLYLARNLLRDDGVIFISVDDNEVSNLRKLCDEIFGEDNFIGLFVVNSSPSAIDYGHMAKMHDYALFYGKTIDDTATSQLPEEGKEFKYEDEKGPFNLYPLYNGNVAFNPQTRPNLYYPFYLNPSNNIGEHFYEISLELHKGWVEVFPVVSKKDSIQRVWRWGRDLSRQHLNQEIVGYKNEDGEFRIVQKARHTGKVIRSLQLDKDISTRRGTGEVEELFGTKLYPFPKPIELMRRFIAVGVQKDGVVLDFFAGSGTTAHAVLELNAQDGGNRKFIIIQLPEPCTPDSTAYKAGFKTITDICKERVRRVIKKLNPEEVGKLELEQAKNLDCGFRVFKLAESNFKPWDAEAPADAESLAKQLELHVHHLRDGRTEQDILFELLLKSGFPLTTPVKVLTLEGKRVYSVAEGAMLICLERELTLGLIRAMAGKKPERLVCLDEGFACNDQLKANAVQIFKTKGVTSFKTV